MKVTISNSRLEATIDTRGAELISLKSSNREFIWEGDPAFWGKHSPVLFPIVGTLKNDQFDYSGKKYSLSRHGFARDMEFAVKEQTEEKVVFSLATSHETLSRYPFWFELQLIYTLEASKLKIEYRVVNNDKQKMPFSIGAHPAFALPQPFEAYTLTFDQDEELQYFLLENDLLSENTERLLLQSNELPLEYSFFERDALVFKHLRSKAITIKEQSVPLLKIDFEAFPNLGIWTKVGAPFICIEPWFGYSDTADSNGNLLEKEGIQVLSPGQVFESLFSIQIL